MSTHNVPYVHAHVVRNPMCSQTRQVPAHEVFVLLNIFPEVHVLGPVVDERSRPVTKLVDADSEYERLQMAYGEDRDTERPKVAEVFGPSHSRAWKDALTQGLDNFDIDEPEAPAAPANPDDAVIRHIKDMMLQDPQREKDDWWRTDGRPEVTELRRRLGGGKLSAADRDRIYQDVQADLDGGQPDSGGIDVAAVQARLDDIDVEYDPAESPGALMDKLHTATVSQIQALGGDVADGATIEQLSTQLDELRAENE